MQKETWVERYLNRDVVDSVTKLASGGLVAAASSIASIPAVVVSSAFSAGVSAFFTRRDIIFKEKQYLNLYKNELGILFHKAPDQVTQHDLEIAAKPVAQGGMGVIALQKQMDFLHYRERYTNIANICTTTLLAATLIAIVVFAPPMLTQFNFLTTTMIGGAGIAFMQKASRSAADAHIKDYGYKFSINKHLMDITTELEQKPVQPTRILGLFVAANPELNTHIKAQYGEEYEWLPFAKKEQALAALEPELHVAALTQEINKGNVRPSIIAFIAYGQSLEGSADYTRYTMLARPQAPEPELTDDLHQNHTAKLSQQRSIAEVQHKLH